MLLTSVCQFFNYRRDGDIFDSSSWHGFDYIVYTKQSNPAGRRRQDKQMEVKRLDEIIKRLKSLDFPQKFDLVVGIARGGIVPAYLAASYLNLPLELVWINFRDRHHQPKWGKPKLIKQMDFEYKNQKILLVDDRTNSGKTFQLAKRLLAGAQNVATLAINGRADYRLFEENCFKMPWDVENLAGEI